MIFRYHRYFPLSCPVEPRQRLTEPKGHGYQVILQISETFAQSQPVKSALQNGGLDLFVDYASAMLNLLVNNTS